MHDLPPLIENRRLKPSFHRTFPLNRSSISSLLSLASRYDTNPETRITKKIIKNETLFGVQYVEAMPRYAQAAGLVDGNNRLTPFGRKVADHDLSIEKRETLWLIHSHLAAPDGLAPRFWSYLVERLVHVGDTLSRDQISPIIKDISQTEQNVSISDGTASDAATVFLKTYSGVASLGGLSILQENGGGYYSVLETESPSAIVFGLVVADYWAKNLPNTSSAYIDEFSKSGGPAQILLMGRGQVNQAMRELSQMGLATVQLNQAPYQFSPFWKSQAELLDLIYNA